MPPVPPAVKVKVKPASAPKAPEPEKKAEPLVVAGRLSATEERARNDARAQLEKQLADLLVPDVPRGWKAPGRVLDRITREINVVPIERDYGTVYQATLVVDPAPEARSAVVAAYHHEQVVKRLGVLGGLLAFVLVCLATLSGYIRADEATKGYYTGKLRLAAAAGVGAAGVLLYQMLS
jgi:hypothetical protein